MFTIKLALKTNPQIEAILKSRMEVARHIYNECVAEMHRRTRLMRASLVYQRARITEDKKEQKLLFKEARDRYECNTGYPHLLGSFLKKRFGSSWHKQHIASSMLEIIGQNVVKTFNKWFIQERGRKKGTPKYYPKNSVTTIYGRSKMDSTKTVGTPISFDIKAEKIIWGGRNIKKLEIPVIINYEDKNIQHALSSKMRTVGITYQRGKYYAIITCDDIPLAKDKHIVKSGVISFDIGLHDIAIVTSDKQVYKVPLCDNLLNINRQIKILDRTIERCRQIANPNNYDDKGSIKRGRLQWVVSNGYKQAVKKRAKLMYKQTQMRKNLHGKLIHWMMTLGNTFKFEEIDYRTWHKGLSKKMRKRVSLFAPGQFIDLLKKEAIKHNLTLYSFSTYKTALSQTCVCGNKKKIQGETYVCDKCGLKLDRDIKSAFLGLFVENDVLNHQAAQAAWQDYCSVLEAGYINNQQILSLTEEKETSVEQMASNVEVENFEKSSSTTLQSGQRLEKFVRSTPLNHRSSKELNHNQLEKAAG